jgi:hypothetical protein
LADEHRKHLRKELLCHCAFLTAFDLIFGLQRGFVLGRHADVFEKTNKIASAEKTD